MLNYDDYDLERIRRKSLKRKKMVKNEKLMFYGLFDWLQALYLPT
jgi:hypothetical protein